MVSSPDVDGIYENIKEGNNTETKVKLGYMRANSNKYAHVSITGAQPIHNTSSVATYLIELHAAPDEGAHGADLLLVQRIAQRPPPLRVEDPLLRLEVHDRPDLGVEAVAYLLLVLPLGHLLVGRGGALAGDDASVLLASAFALALAALVLACRIIQTSNGGPVNIVGVGKGCVRVRSLGGRAEGTAGREEACRGSGVIGSRRRRRSREGTGG